MTNIGSRRFRDDLETPAPKRLKLCETSVTLLEHEKKIFQLVKDANAHFQLGTVVRVAGGWVRDKLLGRDSDDIDFSLDNSAGASFAEHVRNYLVDVLGQESGRVGVVPCNPDQSKHLETARIQLFGHWVDFVNLRTEEYAETSRIPNTRPGTPLEDALRRDLTINSLFYNIHTGEIEDYTGQGLADMENKLIRTPLAPLETFRDDPLRVLRAIRFAARFAYNLHPDLIQGALDESVKIALWSKVSRERIGKEVTGMFESPRPVLAARLIRDLGANEIVFAMPPDGEDWDYEEGLGTMRHAFALLAERSKEGELSYDNRYKRLAMTAALLKPLSNVSVLVKNKPVPVLKPLIMDALKWRTDDYVTIRSMHGAADAFWEMIFEHGMLNNGIEGLGSSDRRRVGLLLREEKEAWDAALDVAAAVAMEKQCGRPEPCDSVAPPLTEKEREVWEKFRQLRKWIHDVGLEGCWKEKPYFNGKELAQKLGIKPGILIGQANAKQIAWILENPDKSKEDCLQYLMQAHMGGKNLDSSCPRLA